MVDPMAFLEAALGRAEELARASNTYRLIAVPGPQVAIAWIVDEELCLLKAGVPTAEHIVEHSPAAVLRRVKADRALLADLQAERHLVVDGDCWFTCPAATEELDGGENCDDDRRGGRCDCGRDARVGRRVRLLAEAWGWEETA